jgi:DNA end-binding protein Ku
VSAKEIEMATRLVEDMSAAFTPDEYRDTYRDDLLERLERKVEKGQSHEVTPAGKDGGKSSAKVIDLMAALRKSLERKGAGPATEARKPPRRASSKGHRSQTSSPAKRSRKRA